MTEFLVEEVSGGEFWRSFRGRKRHCLAKYQQIRLAILDAVSTGAWQPGKRILTEEQLVKLTGYSLGTVQRAMRILVEDGILVRRQGSGTFVRDGNNRISEPWHFQFLDEDGVSVLPAFPKVVARERVMQKGRWSQFLGQQKSPILRIDRTININNEFIGFSRFFVSDEYSESLENLPLEYLDAENFRISLSESIGLPVTEIRNHISTMFATPFIAEKLHVTVGEPVIRVESAATAGFRIPLYFQEIYWPITSRRLALPAIGRDY